VTTTPIRRAVTAYIAQGFRPIPLFGCLPNPFALGTWQCSCGSDVCKVRDYGKHEPPETDGLWKDGHRFSAEDFEEHDNVALAMGPYRGPDWLVCLDVDEVSASGVPSRLVLSEWFDLPATLEAASPRGRHLIHTVPEYSPLGNWTDVLSTKQSHGAALDLRYARGRVVVAPSRSAFGAYRWTREQTPTPLPEAVSWVILDRRRGRGLPVLSEWSRDGKSP
jgi:hypothetical protein